MQSRQLHQVRAACTLDPRPLTLKSYTRSAAWAKPSTHDPDYCPLRLLPPTTNHQPLVDNQQPVFAGNQLPSTINQQPTTTGGQLPTTNPNPASS